MPIIIDGKRISAEIKEEVKERVAALNEQGIAVCLAVVQLGQDPASSVYVRNKKRACEYTGIRSESFELPEDTTEEALLSLIRDLDENPEINGILVQRPLPDHICEEKVLNAISPAKDVDCFHPQNIGKMFLGEKGFLPVTPAGVVELLKRSNIEIAGKECVVVGRSNNVGKPMALLMLREHASVTVVHSRTANIKEITKRADILIVAMGKKHFIDDTYVKEGAVVVDVGIHRDENNKLSGDVNYELAAPHCSAITPVPGGVGPMTIAMLMKNCLDTIKE